ncbi:MAG: hypothetical protein IKK51_07720 [Oscillospiraceae bacterium]|nr:hypothetical protein [Oscillospiraceae bacterium]
MKDKLSKINRFTRRELTAEEVYLFDVILCDNDIDRDGECFSEAALEQMKGLFIGKTGIFDHDPRSSGQTARIFDTEIVQDAEKKTTDGRSYVCLKAHAYMVRTQANEALIAEIEGGIKKEVSVSCCAAKRICSVCGADRRESACGHIDGRMYGEKQCHTILDDIRDAYEWSFVAVPAQVAAGVTKHFSAKEDTVMEMEKRFEQQEKLLAQVEYSVRHEVMQLCSRTKSAAVSKALCMAAEKMGLQELLDFKQALLAEESGVPQVQLMGECMTAVEEFCC